MINWIKNKLSPSTTSAELSSDVISTESSIQSEPEMISTSTMQQSSQPTMAVAEASSTQTTSYLNLKKPGPNDYYNIDDQNMNSDIIDSEVKKHEERISAIESNLDVDNGLRSHDVVTSSHLTSLPNNTKTGGNVQIKSLKGLSLVQITNGGNGENGLNDFLGVNGTLTMEGNTFVLTSGAKQYTAIRDFDGGNC